MIYIMAIKSKLILIAIFTTLCYILYFATIKGIKKNRAQQSLLTLMSTLRDTVSSRHRP
jgi:hypothetical protein